MEFIGDLTTYFKTIVSEQVESYHNDKMYQDAYDFIENFYTYDGMNCCYMKEWFSQTLIEMELIKLGTLHDAIIQSIEWDSTELYEFMDEQRWDTKMCLEEEDENEKIKNAELDWGMTLKEAQEMGEKLTNDVNDYLQTL